MLTINSNEEAQALIVNGVLAVEDDIEIAFDGFDIHADLRCHNIYSKDRPRNIRAADINAYDINVNNLDAQDLNVDDINARDLNIWNFKAHDVNVWILDACDISANFIKAKHIFYDKVCFAYRNITCASIEGRRENASHYCFKGKITIIKD